MKRFFSYFLVFAFCLFLISCKKNNTGGKATIVAFPQHHEKPIFGATVYVKFKSKELPSNPTSDYDLLVAGEPKEDHVHIENLRYGEYYLYAVGWDSTYQTSVKGGLAVKIKWKERAEEKVVHVAVTE